MLFDKGGKTVKRDDAKAASLYGRACGMNASSEPGRSQSLQACVRATALFSEVKQAQRAASSASRGCSVHKDKQLCSLATRLSESAGCLDVSGKAPARTLTGRLEKHTDGSGNLRLKLERPICLTGGSFGSPEADSVIVEGSGVEGHVGKKVRVTGIVRELTGNRFAYPADMEVIKVGSDRMVRAPYRSRCHPPSGGHCD
ncbi:MAG: hypothetical protein WKG00_04745 [Polyangiaceae bacterium]